MRGTQVHDTYIRDARMCGPWVDIPLVWVADGWRGVPTRRPAPPTQTLRALPAEQGAAPHPPSAPPRQAPTTEPESAQDPPTLAAPPGLPPPPTQPAPTEESVPEWAQTPQAAAPDSPPALPQHEHTVVATSEQASTAPPAPLPHVQATEPASRVQASPHEPSHQDDGTQSILPDTYAEAPLRPKAHHGEGVPAGETPGAPPEAPGDVQPPVQPKAAPPPGGTTAVEEDLPKEGDQIPDPLSPSRELPQEALPRGPGEPTEDATASPTTAMQGASTAQAREPPGDPVELAAPTAWAQDPAQIRQAALDSPGDQGETPTINSSALESLD
jgi:hypothetical protein